MEMLDENDSKLLGKNNHDSLIQTPTNMMGTRKRPKDFGRVPNVIGNRQSNDSSMDPSQFRI